eukprot:1159509-Pelagomonas_calceolata.AAC.11
MPTHPAPTPIHAPGTPSLNLNASIHAAGIASAQAAPLTMAPRRCRPAPRSTPATTAFMPSNTMTHASTGRAAEAMARTAGSMHGR